MVLAFYCTPFSDLNMLLNLLSMLDCLSFSVEGGGTPCVFVRFNDPETLAGLRLAMITNAAIPTGRYSRSRLTCSLSSEQIS